MTGARYTGTGVGAGASQFGVGGGGVAFAVERFGDWVTVWVVKETGESYGAVCGTAGFVLNSYMGSAAKSTKHQSIMEVGGLTEVCGDFRSAREVE